MDEPDERISTFRANNTGVNAGQGPKPKPPEPGSVLKWVGAVFGGVLLLIGIGFVIIYFVLGAKGETASCSTETNDYSYCDLSRKTGGTWYRLPFFIDPEKTPHSARDAVRVVRVENDTATIETFAGNIDCRAGQTIPVGMGFLECQKVEPDIVKFKIYKNKPYTG